MLYPDTTLSGSVDAVQLSAMLLDVSAPAARPAGVVGAVVSVLPVVMMSCGGLLLDSLALNLTMVWSVVAVLTSRTNVATPSVSAATEDVTSQTIHPELLDVTVCVAILPDEGLRPGAYIVLGLDHLRLVSLHPSEAVGA